MRNPARKRGLFAVSLAVALFSALSAAALSPAAQVRGRVVVSGRLEVLHSDSFGRHQSRERFELVQGRRRTRLSVSRRKRRAGAAALGPAHSLAKVVPGSRVRVRGVRRGGRLRVTGLRVLKSRRRLAGASAAGIERKTAVIMLYQDGSTVPWTRQQVKNMIFGTLNDFFGEQTGGDFQLVGKKDPSGDVFGWYPVSATNPSSPSDPCPIVYWANQAYSQAQDEYGSLSGYDHIVYLWPRNSGCAWAGFGSVGGKDTWINGYLTVQVIAHEIGHNFGLYHANSLRCTSGGQRVQFSDSCQSVEYGDPFDVMGWSTHHYGPWNKSRMHELGMFPALQTQDVTSSGEYVLSPSTPNGTGVQQLRIRRSGSGDSTRYFFVETRQPFGSFETADRYLNNGLSIRDARDVSVPQYAMQQTQLVDATPATNTFADAPLPVGATFDDPVDGIAVKNLGIDAGIARVQVQFGATGGGDVSAPYSLSASSGGDRVLLSWQHGGGATLYKVYRDGALIGTTSETSYVDSTATPGVSYLYTVTALNGAGQESGASNSVRFTLGASGQVPQVFISNPSDGTLVPRSVKIMATAIDDVRVKRMEVYVDGKRIKRRKGASIHRKWSAKPKRVGSGQHTITVLAYDDAGNVGRQTVTVRKP